MDMELLMIQAPGQQDKPSRPEPSCAEHIHATGEDLWFPDARGEWAPGQIAKAKAICGGCPLLVKCRQQAITDHEIWGIWGATTPNQRRSIWQPGRLIVQRERDRTRPKRHGRNGGHRPRVNTG